MTSAAPLAALVTPALALAGAGAATIPIIIHFFSKRRFQRVRWAAIDFLMEADRRNRRRVKVEELILLAMRCLAMFLIGVMLARWFIRPDTLVALLGSTAHTERIILLDDSFSMNALVRSGDLAAGQNKAAHANVFDRGKSAVHRLVQWIAQETPDDPLTLLLTSQSQKPLRTEVSIGRMDMTAFGTELKNLSPSSRGGNIPGVMADLRKLLDARSGSHSATVYIVSDFQQIDWGRNAAGGAADANSSSGNPRLSRSPVSALADWAEGDNNLRIVLMDVGTHAQHNLSVTAIEPQQAQTIASVSGLFNARVSNFGDTQSETGTLRVYVGDAAQPAAAVPPIPPGQTIEVPIEVTFASEGSETLTVELDPDTLPVDNTRSLVVPVAHALRILLVNGEPSPDAYEDEVYLLNVALRPEGPQFSGNEIVVVDENEFDGTELTNFHAVILANVYRITEELANRLEDYTAAGGGLAIFLGDQIDGELYNRVLYREGKGVLPAKLTDLLTPETDQPGAGIDELNLAHPAMRRFRDTQVPYFEDVFTYRYFVTEPQNVAPAEPASAGSVPAGGENGNKPQSPQGPTHVLIRLNDADKNALLLERSFGKGRVILSATSIDKEWTNLPDRPVFLVLAMELIQHIARAAGEAGDQLVGQPIRFPVDPARYQTGVALRLPNFPEDPEVQVPVQTGPDTGGPNVIWPRTEQPGIYEFTLTDNTGAQSARPIAVNVDPRESDLHRMDRGALLEAMSGLPVEYVAGDALAQEQENQARKELWPPLLLLIMMLLMSEQALAWWFGSDRNLAALWGNRHK